LINIYNKDKIIMKLPIGTKIKFTKNLTADACGEHPDIIYARKGGTGHVVGHDCTEGHVVLYIKKNS
jgi:hypothetical protein